MSADTAQPPTRIHFDEDAKISQRSDVANKLPVVRSRPEEVGVSDGHSGDESPKNEQSEMGSTTNDVSGTITKEFKRQIVWFNVVSYAALHLSALYGLFLIFTKAKILTTIYAILLFAAGVIGTTAGVHRLWSHRAFKAKLPLKIILMTFYTLTFQNRVYDWVRDHRVHHKYSDTNADPYNAKRGFWFSHIGWMVCRKHPDVIAKGKQIDLSDLKRDSVVMFQKKHYWTLLPLISMIIPTIVPMFLWEESFLCAFFTSTILRFTCTLNVIWFVNSLAHMWGNRPYDQFINPAENKFVTAVTLGEGWHNYHHVFPWDYKAAELPTYTMNLTTGFIDLFAKIGWAYDLKTASADMIKKRALKTGDHNHEKDTHFKEDQHPY